MKASEVPAFLLAEYWIGLVLAWLVTRERLVLMRMAEGNSGGSGLGKQQQQQGGEQG